MAERCRHTKVVAAREPAVGARVLPYGPLCSRVKPLATGGPVGCYHAHSRARTPQSRLTGKSRGARMQPSVWRSAAVLLAATKLCQAVQSATLPGSCAVEDHQVSLLPNHSEIEPISLTSITHRLKVWLCVLFQRDLKELQARRAKTDPRVFSCVRDLRLRFRSLPARQAPKGPKRRASSQAPRTQKACCLLHQDKPPLVQGRCSLC